MYHFENILTVLFSKKIRGLNRENACEILANPLIGGIETFNKI